MVTLTIYMSNNSRIRVVTQRNIKLLKISMKKIKENIFCYVKIEYKWVKLRKRTPYINTRQTKSHFYWWKLSIQILSLKDFGFNYKVFWNIDTWYTQREKIRNSSKGQITKYQDYVDKALNCSGLIKAFSEWLWT